MVKNQDAIAGVNQEKSGENKHKKEQESQRRISLKRSKNRSSEGFRGNEASSVLTGTADTREDGSRPFEG